MMLRDRLKRAEHVAAQLRLIVSRFAHVVDAAQKFVDKQAPLARGDFAAPEFDALEKAVKRLLPGSVPPPSAIPPGGTPR